MLAQAQAIGYHSEEEVIQNLKDAGCNQEIIRHFMKCLKQGDWNGQIRLMEEHRKCLLDKVHKEERHIDCLDYLVYQISKNKKNF